MVDRPGHLEMALLPGEPGPTDIDAALERAVIIHGGFDPIVFTNILRILWRAGRKIQRVLAHQPDEDAFQCY